MSSSDTKHSNTYPNNTNWVEKMVIPEVKDNAAATTTAKVGDIIVQLCWSNWDEMLLLTDIHIWLTIILFCKGGLKLNNPI